MESAPIEEVAHLTLLLGRKLLESGADTAQVQSSMVRFAAAFSCEAHLMVSYEAILLTLVSGQQFRTKIGSRVPAMNVNMAVVADVSSLLAEVEAQRASVTEVREKLERIEHQAPVYQRWIVIVAIGLTAGSLARLFGGDWPAFWISWLAGSIGMWFRQLLGRRGFNLFLVPFAGALVSGIIGGIAIHLGFTGTPSLCLAAPGMIIVPGVPLVNGVLDTIKNHITVGLARLGLGTIVTLAIAFGLFVATVVTGANLPVDSPLTLLSVPEDAIFSALAAVGYVFLFNVPVRIAWPGVLCGMASHTIRTFSLHLGVDIATGTLIGALVVGFLAHAFARHFRAPFVTFAFAGVVAMVPGSFAFRVVIGSLEMVRAADSAGTALVAETLSLAATTLLMVAAIAIGIAAPLILTRKEAASP